MGLIRTLLIIAKMAENKKTFIFYSDWINMIKEMPDVDAGQLLKHILFYVNDENPTTDNVLVKMAFGHMKPLIKSDLVKWDEIRNIRKKAGSKGGKTNAKQKQANAKQLEAVNVNVNVTDNGTVNKSIEGRKADFKKSLRPFVGEFKKEMIQEFFEYWSEHGENDKKMRFEKQTSFGIKRRLTTWLKKQEEIEKEKSSVKKEKSNVKLR